MTTHAGECRAEGQPYGPVSDTLAAAVSILFHGTALAMVLYLISVGLSVTMGLMGFVNLAHGVFAMLGGYVLTSLISRLGVPFVIALAAAAVATALASVVVERLLYRRLYGADDLDQVLLTMGLIFMSVAGATYFWGPLATADAAAAPGSAAKSISASAASPATAVS